VAGRVVLVTGASSGIGRETAARFARAGATVVGCGRDERRLAAAAAEIGMSVHRCDVTDAQDREDLVDAMLLEHGRIDVLVNNAGIGWAGLVEDMAVDDVQHLYDTNVVAVVDLTRRVLPGMLARGDGDVVVVSSGAAFVSLPPLTVYSSTKYAVDGFVEGLRREVHGRGVRIHSVNPGPVRTEWLARSMGTQPDEADGSRRLSPGVPASWVAAAIERSASRAVAYRVRPPRRGARPAARRAAAAGSRRRRGRRLVPPPRGEGQAARPGQGPGLTRLPTRSGEQ